MKRLMAIILGLMIGAVQTDAGPDAASTDCVVENGIPIPCATVQERLYGPYPDNPKHMTFQEPLFHMNNVAKDSPPEQVETLNHPTWENAHKAAVSRIYRNYKIFVATQMIMAVQKAIVDDVKTRHGLSDKDYMTILEIVVREHGLPTLDLDAMGLKADPVLEAATRALSAVSGGRQP